MGRYDDKLPKEAVGMFRSRIRRVCGHAVIFAWSDLVVDRSRKLVDLQSPAACATRAGGDSDPNSENYDLFHASLRTPDGMFTYVRGGRTRMPTSGLVSWVLFEGEFVGSVTRWPQRVI